MFFFFSSRRRHTRLQGDWSSDVCSSDLIGLALVKSLVQLHGGTVTGQSNGPGRGSLFTVRLPALEMSEHRYATHLAPLSIATRGRSILLVDDNEDAAAMLAEILRAAGHDVRTAADGPAALEVAKEF